MMENPTKNGTGPTRGLYPPIEPFRQQILDVPGDHKIYVEQCGNPEGVPVVVLHGGPGGGCSPGMRRFFDPNHYRVILFDQRGCGRSTPNACVENNTTWDLVADIERIREDLGIEKWMVFGGSWGACLALIYGQTHPARVTSMILRGVFTMTQSELLWFYGGGAGRFWPEQWRSFSHMVPANERGDLINAYSKRLFGTDQAEQIRFARAWAGWESSLAVLEPAPGRGNPSGSYARAFSRIENHYFRNAGFLTHDRQIHTDMHRLAGIPGHIVQGRYDMICPPGTALSIHKAWPASQLHMISDAGHAMFEPGICSKLLAIMEALKSPETGISPSRSAEAG